MRAIIRAVILGLGLQLLFGGPVYAVRGDLKELLPESLAGLDRNTSFAYRATFNQPASRVRACTHRRPHQWA